jgi:hypothetical protein
LGFEKRCALPGIRAEEDVAKSKELPGRRPTFDKGARGDENLRHYVRGFPVGHSLLALAVGYRVSAGRACIFYAPDLIFIHGRSTALKNVRVYIGDGATFTRSFIRKRGERLIGHAAISVQIGWCAKAGVSRAIITHCGLEIVTGDERNLAASLHAMGADRGVETRIAHDRMELALR